MPVVEVRIWFRRLTSVDSAALGKSCCRSSKMLVCSCGMLEHLRGEEQRDQRQREDREQQVVGHHRGHPRDVVLVGLEVEALQGRPDGHCALAAGEAAERLAGDRRADADARAGQCLAGAHDVAHGVGPTGLGRGRGSGGLADGLGPGGGLRLCGGAWLGGRLRLGRGAGLCRGLWLRRCLGLCRCGAPASSRPASRRACRCACPAASAAGFRGFRVRRRSFVGRWGRIVVESDSSSVSNHGRAGITWFGPRSRRVWRSLTSEKIVAILTYVCFIGDLRPQAPFNTIESECQ